MTANAHPAAADDDEDEDDGSAIAALVHQARTGLDRVEPGQLAAQIDAGALVVDIRPAANRDQEGTVPGAVVIERIHLEWRLDPTSPHRIPEAAADRRVVVMCNEGYASSLAAATLRSLGVSGATDLAGGYRAWVEWTGGAGLDRGDGDRDDDGTRP